MLVCWDKWIMKHEVLKHEVYKVDTDLQFHM